MGLDHHREDMVYDTWRKWYVTGPKVGPRARDREVGILGSPPFGRLTAVVDLDALRSNLQVVRGQVPPNTEVTASLKANAYGHGIETVGRCLEEQGVRWFAVGNPAEALALRGAGLSAEIWLFAPLPQHGISELLKAGVTFSVESYTDAERLVHQAPDEPVRVMLKVDCGLGRLGVPLTSASSEAERIVTGLSTLAFEGVFTHLPFSKPDSVPWIQDRTDEFCEAVKAIRELVQHPILAQSNASAGIVGRIDAPETNAVCTGQLLYGLDPQSLVTPQWPGTNPVMRSVESAIRSLRSIASGTRFGVDGSHRPDRSLRLGLIPAGYADSPLQDRLGQVVYIRGELAPVVGVSVEHTSVDLTGIPNVTEGDAVYLFSTDPSEGVSLEEFALMQGRTRIEVLVSLTGATYRYVSLDDSMTRKELRSRRRVGRNA